VIDSGFRQLGLLGEAAQQLGKGGAGGTVTPAAPAPAAPRGQPQPAPRR
jgi:biopolymer transport protein TolR